MYHSPTSRAVQCGETLLSKVLLSSTISVSCLLSHMIFCLKQEAPLVTTIFRISFAHVDAWNIIQFRLFGLSTTNCFNHWHVRLYSVTLTDAVYRAKFCVALSLLQPDPFRLHHHLWLISINLLFISTSARPGRVSYHALSSDSAVLFSADNNLINNNDSQFTRF